MIPNLLKDLATLVCFFLLALLPSQIEAYVNEGHFIINTNIVFMSWLLAMLIFIVGKTVKWYFNYEKVARDEEYTD